MYINFLLTIKIFSHGIGYEFFENAKGLRFFYEDKTPLSLAEYKIYSPDGKIFSEGKLDRNGRVLFLPNKKGKWKIEIDDGMGHGIVKEIMIENLEKDPFLNNRISFNSKLVLGLSIILMCSGITFYILAYRKLKNAHS
ncbi:MAG: hypothetical protein ABDH37_05315 [Candidatus Hydrothermales bacterium]